MIDAVGELATNTARFAAESLPGGGTPTSEWVSWRRDFPTLDLTTCPSLVLVAPHPDDETLGFGAAAAMVSATGVDVQVVSVSDGGAAYPDLSAPDRTRLEHTRRTELSNAADILGVGEPIRLGLPDGDLSDHDEPLTDLLIDILRARPTGTWCAATWRGDGHPDHAAVGRAAAQAATLASARLIEYPVWMWHWASPGDAAVPWYRARRVPLSPSAINTKQRAALSFRSQFDVVAPQTAPVLPPFVLPRHLAVGELVFL